MVFYKIILVRNIYRTIAQKCSGVKMYLCYLNRWNLHVNRYGVQSTEPMMHSPSFPCTGDSGKQAPGFTFLYKKWRLDDQLSNANF